MQLYNCLSNVVCIEIYLFFNYEAFILFDNKKLNDNKKLKMLLDIVFLSGFVLNRHFFDNLSVKLSKFKHIHYNFSEFTSLARLVNFINSYNSDRKIVIVGHSMGGMYALLSSLVSNKNIAGLVLLSSAASFMASDGNKANSVKIMESMKQSLFQEKEKFLRKFLRGCLTNDNIDNFNFLLKQAMDYSAEDCLKGLNNLENFDIKDKLYLIKYPALIIHGAKDTIIPFSGSIDLHKQIEGSHLIKIDNVGHDLNLFKDSKIVDDIVSFIDDLNG